MKRRLDRLWDLLFPPRCPFCGRLLDRTEQLVCPACARELPWLRGPECHRAVELTSGCVAVLRYQDQVREAIHGYKFGGRSGRAPRLGALIARQAEAEEMSFDLVSWPSLSKKRLRSRGYDQAELLARAVGETLDRPVIRTLEKLHRPAQSGLVDPGKRRANLLGAYSVPEPERVRGRHILLVDDVVTTGSTLAECAKTLRLAGAENVVCAVLARAGG